MLKAISRCLSAASLNLDEPGVVLDLISWTIYLLKGHFVLPLSVGKNSVVRNIVIVVEFELCSNLLTNRGIGQHNTHFGQYQCFLVNKSQLVNKYLVSPKAGKFMCQISIALKGIGRIKGGY
jgi:hypothetical protein